MKGMFWKGNMDFGLYLEGNDLTNLVQGKALEAKLVNDGWKSIDKKLILKKQGKGEQLEGEEDGVFFKK